MSGNAKNFFSEGIEFYVNKQYDRAIMKWNQALSFDPGNSMMKSYISKAKVQMKKGAGGGKVTPAQEEEIKKLYYGGLKKYTGGDLDGAISMWKQVLKINPEDIKTLRSIEKAQAEQAELKKRGIK